MLPHSVIKITRESANDGFITGIGPTKTATRQTAEMTIWPDEDDPLAHRLGLDRGHHASTSPAIHDYIVVRDSGKNDGPWGHP